MIQLHRNYLLLQTASGEFIPCSAEIFSLQLLDSVGSIVDPEIIQHAASAVLHYFKHEQGRESITVAEFSGALEQALKGIGLKLSSAGVEKSGRSETADLRALASEIASGFELAFFLNLRNELRVRLENSPQVLRFEGLRVCVKELLGAKRWSHRCQTLNDQIVNYLRDCLKTEAPESRCGLVVS